MYDVNMRKRFIVAGYRLLFAVLTLVAMGVQLHQSVLNGGSIVNFFSFFTIESNLIAAFVFVLSGVALLQDKQDDKLALLRGATALYMTTTGIVYVLLLSGLEASLQTAVPWINAVVHYIMPAVVFLDWFICLPQQRVRFVRALWWLVFPVCYVIYSLIRGPLAHWYPYPFLDPRAHGYAMVAGMSIGIAGAAIGLTAGLSFATYLRRK